MRCFLILIDSLNRNYLPCYNKDTCVHADNLNAFSSDAITFDAHYVGSAPCMPARRDIFTGRLNFLERPWGGIEPYDTTFVQILRNNGIFTHITTDHPHYFEIGGENYCQQFDTWNFERGQEGDAWISKANGITAPAQYFGKWNRQNQANRSAYHREEDYPTPRTFASACDWVRENKDADNYFLMVEAFDPHEPFDTPQSFVDAYNDDYDGPAFDWPSYRAIERETPEACEHLRKKYAATVTMMDKWFGTFIQTLKDEDVYNDSLIIVTSDHGHMLGEHGFFAKGFMHMYDELARIPLLMKLPNGRCAGTGRNMLTQNIDLMPTILQYYGIDVPQDVLGISLFDVLDGRTPPRDACIYGYFGKTVNVTDGTYTYFRAPARPDNTPCFVYGAMPTTFLRYITVNPKDIQMGRYLPYTDYPVYRFKFQKDGAFFGTAGDLTYMLDNLLFDVSLDPGQECPQKDAAIEARLIQKLKNCMEYFQSPKEQYQRLGLDD